MLDNGPGISVGIAADYRLDGPGIESRWGRDFSPVQTGPGAHPASCTMGTGSFPGVNYGWGVLLTTHPLLVPRSWKSRAILLPTLWATTGPVTGKLYILDKYIGMPKVKIELRTIALPLPVQFCMSGSQLVGRFLSSITWGLQVHIILLLFL